MSSACVCVKEREKSEFQMTDEKKKVHQILCGQIFVGAFCRKQ